jgi:hypothetical protein
MARTKSTIAGGYIIAAEEDEALFREYTRQRDEIRNVMGCGVYPNLVKALAVYAAFDAALSEGGALGDADLLAYHATLFAPIAPYVKQIRTAAQGITDTMLAIELASPGTFGISAQEQP